MEKRRCIFCMREMPAGEQKCPFCKKALWQYHWESRWLKPYTMLNGRYLVGKVLGEGAFGTTYLAYDKEEAETVAIKVYSGTEYPEEVSVLEETEGIPGTVRKKNFFQEEGSFCLVMEYLGGGSLKDYIKKQHTVQAERAVQMLFPVMETLVLLHGKGMIHGDISPDNLLFDQEGTLKLIDFGAVIRKGKNRSVKELKEGYAPIEQYQDREKVGPWTDLYALCAVWYEMVTGHKVPPAPQRMKKEILREPSDYVKMPEKIEQAFLRGLSVDIQRRYFSVENLLVILSRRDTDVDEGENIRRIWGDLWIKITTKVERGDVSGKRKGRVRKILRTAGGIFLGLAVAATLFTGGLWFYCDTHPEEVLAYRLEKDREEGKNLKSPRGADLDSKEVRQVEEYLKENAYDVKYYDTFTSYSMTESSLKGWNYRGDEETFPIKAETLKSAVDLLQEEERKQEKTDLTGTVAISHSQGLSMESSLEWNYFCYYGEARLWIDYDIVTDYVTSLMFYSPDKEKSVDFIYEILPLVSPESYLDKEEIREIFRKAEEESEYGSVDVYLNCKCSVDLAVDTYSDVYEFSMYPR